MPAPEIDVAPLSSAPCPLCRRAIMPGDSAGLHTGRILHLDCYITVVQAGVTMLASLKTRPRAALCTTCLVGASGVSFDEAMLARSWLTAQPGIHVDVDRCRGCGGRRVTLLHAPSPAVSAPTTPSAAD